MNTFAQQLEAARTEFVAATRANDGSAGAEWRVAAALSELDLLEEFEADREVQELLSEKPELPGSRELGLSVGEVAEESRSVRLEFQTFGGFCRQPTNVKFANH